MYMEIIIGFVVSGIIIGTIAGGFTAFMFPSV